MARCLIVVSRRLWVRGKGLALDPAYVTTQDERVSPGDRVTLRRPDGSTLETMIRGTATESSGNIPGRFHLWLDLIDRNEVPIGTEVWSIER